MSVFAFATAPSTLIINAVYMDQCFSINICSMEVFSFFSLSFSLSFLASFLLHSAGLDVATCGVANLNVTRFRPLATNFSRVVASLATAISSYYFIVIYFFIS